MVVLHRRWGAITHLRQVLVVCQHPVVIAAEGERLVPGTVYIGTPADHLTLLADHLGGLIHDPRAYHRNRTVDLLLTSVATHAAKRAIGVILSGNLDDGSRGLAAIHEAGGITMVIERQGHRRGMPENAIAYDGPIDVIGGFAEIAAIIGARVGGVLLGSRLCLPGHNCLVEWGTGPANIAYQRTQPVNPASGVLRFATTLWVTRPACVDRLESVGTKGVT